MQHVPARARLIREDEVWRLRFESANQSIDVGLARPDRADEDRWVGALALRVGDRNRIFVDVQTDIPKE